MVSVNGEGSISQREIMLAIEAKAELPTHADIQQENQNITINEKPISTQVEHSQSPLQSPLVREVVQQEPFITAFPSIPASISNFSSSTTILSNVAIPVDASTLGDSSLPRRDQVNPFNLAVTYSNHNPRSLKNPPNLGSLAQEVQDCLTQEQLLGQRLGFPVQHQLRNYLNAITCYERTLELARQANDPLTEKYVLYNLGVTNETVGNYAKAIEYHQQRLQLAQSQQDPLEQGKALRSLGKNYAILGNYDQGTECDRVVVECG
jgi:tetratricopeptide (TPR) repeat protein